MKGIALQINTIVVVAIAVLVLVVLAAFFAGWLGVSTSEMSLETSLNKACSNWRSLYNCADSGYVDNPDPVSEDDLGATAQYQALGDEFPRSYSVAELCNLAGYTTEDACRRKCGCVLTTNEDI